MKDSPLHRPLPGLRKEERGRRRHRGGGDVAGGDRQLFGWAKENWQAYWIGLISCIICRKRKRKLRRRSPWGGLDQVVGREELRERICCHLSRSSLSLKLSLWQAWRTIWGCCWRWWCPWPLKPWPSSPCTYPAVDALPKRPNEMLTPFNVDFPLLISSISDSCICCIFHSISHISPGDLQN